MLANTARGLQRRAASRVSTRIRGAHTVAPRGAAGKGRADWSARSMPLTALALTGVIGAVYVGNVAFAEDDEHDPSVVGLSIEQLEAKMLAEKAEIEAREYGYFTQLMNKWDSKFQDAVDAVFNRVIPDQNEAVADKRSKIDVPLLPAMPQTQRRDYTLVLDMDLLVTAHFSQRGGWCYRKRAGVDYFLAMMAEHYELVLVTNKPYGAATPLIDRVDPAHSIVHKLYQDSLGVSHNTYLKPLEKLGRSEKKVIVLDHRFAVTSPHMRDNVIILKPWSGAAGMKNQEDLLDTMPFLTALATSKVDDVRPVIAKFHDKQVYIPARHRSIRKQQQEQHRAQAVSIIHGTGMLQEGQQQQ